MQSGSVGKKTQINTKSGKKLDRRTRFVLIVEGREMGLVAEVVSLAAGVHGNSLRLGNSGHLSAARVADHAAVRQH